MQQGLKEALDLKEPQDRGSKAASMGFLDPLEARDEKETLAPGDYKAPGVGEQRGKKERVAQLASVGHRDSEG